MMFFEGGEADADYLKVAKKHDKRAREAKEKAEVPRPKRGRGYGYGFHHGYGRGYPPMQSLGWQGAQAGPSSSMGAPRFNRRETSRCNNCAEFGHFARECSKPPLPPSQK